MGTHLAGYGLRYPNPFAFELKEVQASRLGEEDEWGGVDDRRLSHESIRA